MDPPSDFAYPVPGPSSLPTGAAGGQAQTRTMKKHRERFTCTHCRVKRIACNRKDPCQQCLDRHIVCDWTGAKPLSSSTNAVPAGRNLFSSSALASYPVPAPASERAESSTGMSRDPSAGSSSTLSRPRHSTTTTPVGARILANRKRMDQETLQATLSRIQSLLAKADRREEDEVMAREEKGGLQRLMGEEGTVPLDSVDDLASALSTLAVSQAMATSVPISVLPDPGPPPPGGSEEDESAKYRVSRFDREGLKVIKDITFSIGPTTTDRRPRPARFEATGTGRDAPNKLFGDGLGFADPPIDELLRRLPSLEEIGVLRDLYEQRVAWLCRLLHGPTFEAQINAVAQKSLVDYLPSPSTSAQPTPSFHTERYSSSSSSSPPFIDPGGNRSTSGSPMIPRHIANLHSLAVMFGVLGLALSTCQDQLSVQDYLDMGLPVVYKGREEEVGCQWLRSALSALRLGDFAERPTLEAIRAIVIIVQMPLYASNGESLGDAVAFAGQGLDIARRHGLHAEVDYSPWGERITEVQRQDRRRVMYGLLDAVWRMRGVVRMHGDAFPPTEFPLPLPGQMGRSTPPPPRPGQRAPDGPAQRRQEEEDADFTALNFRIMAARFIQEVGLLYADAARPPTHSQILAMDGRLRDLESQFPPECRLVVDEDRLEYRLRAETEPKYAMDVWAANGTISLANIILHRGMLIKRDGVPVEAIAMHRQRVLEYGLRMMCQVRTGLFPASQVPIAWFIINAAIALGVWLLTGPVDARFTERVRVDLAHMSDLCSPLAATSSILRRSWNVLEYLLRKDRQRVEESGRRRRDGKKGKWTEGDEDEDVLGRVLAGQEDAGSFKAELEELRRRATPIAASSAASTTSTDSPRTGEAHAPTLRPVKSLPSHQHRHQQLQKGYWDLLDSPVPRSRSTLQTPHPSTPPFVHSLPSAPPDLLGHDRRPNGMFATEPGLPFGGFDPMLGLPGTVVDHLDRVTGGLRAGRGGQEAEYGGIASGPRG